MIKETIATFLVVAQLLVGGAVETCLSSIDEVADAISYVSQYSYSESTSGEWVLTAYCPCEICCGEYAYGREYDEAGKPIVYTSIGARAVQGVTIAVDPSVIPYGTEVTINGHTYIAQDCGGAVNGNHIDVYFDNHTDAWNFGTQWTSDVQIG